MIGESDWFNYAGQNSRVRFRRLRSGGFRSSHLNLAGWMAVLLPGLVVGSLVGMVSGRAVVLTAVLGGLVSWVIALGLDFIAWRRLRGDMTRRGVR